MAIKILPAHTEVDDNVLQRLRGELRVTQVVCRIRPNVAAVYAVDRTDEGRACVVMEPLDGFRAAGAICREAAFPIERAMRVAFQIADGLQAAHNCVLVHGALDPEHVLVGPGDIVKLTGFEVARLRGAGPSILPADSASAVLVGGSERALAEWADIHALGFLLVGMLTGSTSPRIEGPASGLLPAFEFGRHVPAQVRRLVLGMLAGQPREQDMAFVANSLWTELNRVVEVPARHRAWPQGARWVISGIAVLVFTGTAAGVWSMRSYPKSRVSSSSGASSDRAPSPGVHNLSPGVHELTIDRRSSERVTALHERATTLAPKRPLADGEPSITTNLFPDAGGHLSNAPPTTTTASREVQGGARPLTAPAPTRSAVRRSPTSAPSDSAQTASRARSAIPENRPPRQESGREREAPDPSDVIDWLLNEHQRQFR